MQSVVAHCNAGAPRTIARELPECAAQPVGNDLNGGSPC